MSFTLVIKEEAYGDLQDAYDYYEEQVKGLGDRFLNAVREKISYIRKHPFHFNAVEEEFRQALVDRFPFLILYEVSGYEIVVYAFFHCSRNPKRKFKR